MANLGRVIAALGALGAGYVSGKKMAEDQAWEEEKRNQERAARQAASDTLGKVGTMTTPAVSGEDALAAGQGSMEQALAGATTEEQKAGIRAAYEPTINALQAQRGAAAVESKPYTRDQAMTDYIQRIGAIDPVKAAQTEATQQQLEEGRFQADRRKKLQEVDGALRAWGEKNIQTGEDGKPILNDDAMINLGKMRVFELGKRGLYDDALKTAQDSMQYATRKIEAEQVQRQAAVRDAVAAVGMGDYSKAMSVYNQFVPDGSKAVGVVKNKDGSYTVQRVSAVDGSPLADGKFKDTDQFVSSLGSLADSKSLTSYIDRTFQHDIESRRLGIEGGKLQVAKDAEARQAGKDAREEARQDAVRKGLADYTDAEAANDAKGMSAARRAILANGGKLEKPEALKPEVKVGQIGDITVSQPTGGGGVQVTNYGPDMKAKGTVTVAPPGAAALQAATPKTQADFDKLPSGTIYVDPQDGKKYRKP